MPLSLDFPHVFHRTMSFSLPEPWSRLPPFLIIRSERIVNFTLPTTGTLPQATGAVHNAATYAIRPDTFGRCGCVEGNRCNEIWGESISCGRGCASRVGSCSCNTRTAMKYQHSTLLEFELGRHKLLPSLTVRSSGGFPPSTGFESGNRLGTEPLNHTSGRSRSKSRTFASALDGCLIVLAMKKFGGVAWAALGRPGVDKFCARKRRCVDSLRIRAAVIYMIEKTCALIANPQRPF